MGIPSSWLPLLVAALLAALSLWLNQVAGKAPAGADGAVGHVPDLIVERFNATAFDRQGQPRHTLTASRMLHYADDDTTDLDAPRMLQQVPGAPAIHVASDRGTVSPDGEHVTLLGEVSLEQEAQQGGEPLRMTTDFLQVSPDAEQMRTHRPVRLERGGDVLTADSLFSDGKARMLQLQGHVRGFYEVRH